MRRPRRTRVQAKEMARWPRSVREIAFRIHAPNRATSPPGRTSAAMITAIRRVTGVRMCTRGATSIAHPHVLQTAWMAETFANMHDVESRLRSVGYLPSPEIASTVFLADRLEKPVLVEG